MLAGQLADLVGSGNGVTSEAISEVKAQQGDSDMGLQQALDPEILTETVVIPDDKQVFTDTNQS